MKREKLICCLVIISALLILPKCTKDDDSAYQPKGNYGNATILTQSFYAASTAWSHTGTAGSSGDGYAVTFNCSILTQSVVNDYLVMAYMSFDDASWLTMPFTLPLGSSSYAYSETWWQMYSLNQIEFVVSDNDFLTMQPTDNVYFKVVAISPDVVAANKNLDFKNYAEVDKALLSTSLTKTMGSQK